MFFLSLLFGNVAKLKICTKPLWGVCPRRNLPLVPTCLGLSLLVHQRFCCFPRLPASSLRPRLERSLCDPQIRSDCPLPLDRALGIQIPGEPGPASVPKPWQFPFPALLTGQQTSNLDLSLGPLPGTVSLTPCLGAHPSITVRISSERLEDCSQDWVQYWVLGRHH